MGAAGDHVAALALPSGRCFEVPWGGAISTVTSSDAHPNHRARMATVLRAPWRHTGPGPP